MLVDVVSGHGQAYKPDIDQVFIREIIPPVKRDIAAFHNCSSLVAINSAINVSNLTSQMDSTFTGCANLEVLEFTGTLRVDTWLSGAPKLTVVSLLSVIDSLADFSGTGTSKKITFGARNKAKLTAAQLALVTDKGWVLG